MVGTAKNRGLGKGLDALLGRDLQSSFDDVQKTLDVDLIQPGKYQPRSIFDQTALQGLADSIRSQGVMQPIIVRALEQGDQYQIIAGERRWRAAQLAGVHQVPVIIREVPDRAALCMALIENIQREDLNPLEEAQALERLITQFEMTHEEAAEAIGKSRPTVSNLLRLLELSDEVQEMVRERSLEMGHARALLACPRQQQIALAGKIVHQQLSVRAAEGLVRGLNSSSGTRGPVDKAVDPNILGLQNTLSERLGTQIQIKQNRAGKGRLQIYFHSLAELEGILKRIR